jgi:hypothetical protein
MLNLSEVYRNVCTVAGRTANSEIGRQFSVLVNSSYEAPLARRMSAMRIGGIGSHRGIDRALNSHNYPVEELCIADGILLGWRR